MNTWRRFPRVPLRRKEKRRPDRANRFAMPNTSPCTCFWSLWLRFLPIVSSSNWTTGCESFWNRIRFDWIDFSNSYIFIISWMYTYRNFLERPSDRIRLTRPQWFRVRPWLDCNQTVEVAFLRPSNKSASGPIQMLKLTGQPKQEQWEPLHEPQLFPVCTRDGDFYN
jgi:hypothetical protein